jgi:hypothetical protein
MLRALAFALIIAAGACSAVDDFSRFKFAGDGGTTVVVDMRVVSDGSSAPGPDMTTVVTPPGFGEVCTVDCATGFTCFQIPNSGSNGNKTTVNICSRSCSSGNVTACTALDATCVTVENMTLCMPNCTASKVCRSDLTCCSNKMPNPPIVGDGQCAPPNSDFCGG